MGEEEFGEKSWYSFLFGDPPFFDGGMCRASEGKAQERLQLSTVEGLGGPGWTFSQGPLSRSVVFIWKTCGSLAVVGSLLGEVWIPRVQAAELSCAG